MRVKTNISQSFICQIIILQGARIVQAEGGNRLQAVGWCIAKITSALISFVKLDKLVIYYYLVSFGHVRYRIIT